MNQTEHNEISQLPEKYKPLSAWSYFGHTILFSIPLIGFVCLIICALSNGNINKRNFARSYFCGIVLVLVVAVITVVLGGGLAAILDKIPGLQLIIH